MASYYDISPDQAGELIKNGALAIDIRDEESFSQGHIPQATHLSSEDFSTFLEKVNTNQVMVVYCYHGISSKPVVEYLAQGVECKFVYNLAGGFEAWQTHFPEDIVAAA